MKKWVIAGVAALIAFAMLGMGYRGVAKIARETSASEKSLVDQKKLQEQIIDDQKYLISLQNDIQDYRRQISAIQAQNEESKGILHAWASQAPGPELLPQDAPPPTDSYVVNIGPQAPPSEQFPDNAAASSQPAPPPVYESYVAWGCVAVCANCDNGRQRDRDLDRDQRQQATYANTNVPAVRPPAGRAANVPSNPERSHRASPPAGVVQHGAPRAAEIAPRPPAAAPMTVGMRAGYGYYR